jgi:hypothetical protein
MKKCIFSSLLALLVLFAGSRGISQNVFQSDTEKDYQLHLKKITEVNERYKRPSEISLPQKTNLYEWNELWVWYEFEETSYLQDGRISQEITYDTTQSPKLKDIYTYDAQKRLTEMLSLSWVTGAWVNSSKSTQIYDEHGNMIEYMWYQWDGTAFQPTYGNRITFTYDQHGWITEEIHENFSVTWFYSSKYIYTLDAGGFPTEILIQSWEDVWINNERDIEISWLDYNPEYAYGRMLSRINQTWSENEWITSFKEVTSYDDSGGYTSIEQYFDGTNWVDTYRTIMTIVQNYVSEYKSEHWDGASWIQDFGARYQHSFDGIDLTETIIQMWNGEMQYYENEAKYIYSDFIHVPYGIPENVPAVCFFDLYPNPVVNELTIRFTNSAPSADIEIINLMGEVVYHQSLTGIEANQSFNIKTGQMAKGYYLVHFVSGSSSAGTKILIE